MGSQRDIVSRVRSTHRLLSADNQINDRTVLAECKSSARLLIKQRLDKRQLINTPTIYTPINCLEMEEVSIAECCDYISDKMVGRSVHRLPKIGEGSFGLAIQGVFSIEGNKKLKETNPNRYANQASLGLKTPDLFYWIYDQYLYVSDSAIQMVKIIAYFEEDVPEHITHPENSCCPSRDRECTSPLDKEFKCPGFLEDTVVKMVSQYLLQTYFRIPNDITSDGKDAQTQQAK